MQKKSEHYLITLKAAIITLLAALSVLLISLTIQDSDVSLAEYKPTTNFNWLNQPCFLSKCVNITHWETDKDFTFDTAGIIKNKGTYHPVVVSQYALVCFDTYMSTKDNKYKEKFLKQIKYLINPKLYTTISENVVGYPYTVAFHDLKAPWYSGLAQSEVLGVLVRYYSLTKDKSVLPLMAKIRNFITVRVEKNGLLNTTAQGCTWIEEYPNSKQHLHVLNGFMVTLIFLDDYCRFFPDDVETRKLVDDCFESLRSSIIYYDTGSWLKYDRGSTGDVKTWYMKAQVIEADQLYEITRDDFFKKAGLLWGTYSYNKVIGYKGCLIDSTNFSVPCDKGLGGVLKPKTSIAVFAARSDIKHFSLNDNDSIKQVQLVQRMFDNNLNSTCKFMRSKDCLDAPVVQLDFIKPITLTSIGLVSNSKKLAKYSDGISFSYREDSLGRWKKLHLKLQTTDSTTLLFKNDLCNAWSVRISFDGIKDSDFVEVGEIQIKMAEKLLTSDYAFYQTDNMNISADEMKFVFDKTDVDSFTVFVKSELTVAKLNTQKYDVGLATINKFPIIRGKGLNARFLVVFKRGSANSSIGNLRLE